ncbi:enoyl-CoA hydratase [Streptomyces phaeoluteigriseus]|uniref:Enoyl-CoA hydratase n=1 Tax=Streptomyces phaeoluteigriseus TaxID=114686 RepID=A0A1V6MIT6_9ACTN|nr:enoyl-CoA hydratase/isomerase family protein [Streptomyces phaeoluteigriseus]OQD52381.1 enoyl-CoA hydratase [Streptomyces phaeoluteigriseus]
MAEERVRYESHGGVAQIVLARPARANAVDLPTVQAFAVAVDKAFAADIRAVIVRGEGERFCAGGDLKAMADAVDRPAYLEELANAFDRALQKLATLPKPVIAAVQGSVAGAGIAVMLSCDLVVSAASTRFLTAYSTVGLTPDCGISFLLPRAIGLPRALELALTGRTLSGEEAKQWGLVNEVVEDELLEARAQELGNQLAAGPTWALGQAKQLMRDWQASREQMGRKEALTIADAVTRADAKVIQSFATSKTLEGRPDHDALV